MKYTCHQCKELRDSDIEPSVDCGVLIICESCSAMPEMWGWIKDLETAYHRNDCCYAGKDHTKTNKTFICISNDNEERTGFKTLESAQNYADKHWPFKRSEAAEQTRCSEAKE